MKKSILTKKEAECLMEENSPLYIYSEEEIRKNIKRLKQAFSWNKGFREYFAVKANPIPDLLEIFAQEGCGFDCSSDTELTLASCINAPIMFSSNVTPAEEFIHCKELGGIINLDDLSHVDFLAKTAGIPETICCRYNSGGNFDVSPNCMGTPGDAKYGMTKPQIFEAFEKLKN